MAFLTEILVWCLVPLPGMVYVVLRQLHYRLLGFPLVLFQAGMQCPLFDFFVLLILVLGGGN